MLKKPATHNFAGDNIMTATFKGLTHLADILKEEKNLLLSSLFLIISSLIWTIFKLLSSNQNQSCKFKKKRY